MSAQVKAEHVRRLLAQTADTPATVLEVGCGDGALLAELAALRIGSEHTGVEVSDAAVKLASRHPGINVIGYDGRELPFGDRSFDLVVCSHVLEHVEDPGAMMAELARVTGRLLLVEVPLEKNLLARRAAAVRLSRLAGHVQAFDRRAIRRLLPDQMRVVAELTDPLPRQAATFWSGQTRGTLIWGARQAVAALGLGERLMTMHYAVLVSRG